MISRSLKLVTPHLTRSLVLTEMLKEFPYNLAIVERTGMAVDRHLEPLANVGTHTSASFSPNHALGRSTREAPRSRRSAGRKPSSHLLKLSVLVVDDVPDVTEMIALFLKHAGYDVTTADSATTALQLANERTFNLVISDIGMPEMNGYELAETLRSHAEYQRTPMIAVTGYSEYDDRTRAIQSGFNSHLTKPIDPKELLNLINELLMS